MRNKGNRLEKFLLDYTVFDIETCGLSQELRNHIIEISALKVRNGAVVNEFSSLVKPIIRIPSRITEITGIDDHMVVDAPYLETVLPSFLSFVGDDALVGYNINCFDYNIIYDLAQELLNQEVNNDFVDIIYAARRNVRDIPDIHLTTLCSHFNIDYTGAHRSLRDCYLTKQVYEKLYEQFGKNAFDGGTYEVDQMFPRSSKLSEETILLKELQQILETIVSDGEVTEDEVSFLQDWIDNNIHLSGNYPFDRVFGLLEMVMEDGVIDKDELLMLMDKFIEYIDPVKTTCEDVSAVEVKDKHFVLTGEFNYGARSSVEEYIASQGGIIDGNVKKTTNYVVVGSLGSQAWKNGNYGSKIKKAIELRDKGICIDIIEEKDFFGKKMEQLELYSTNELSWKDTINDAIEKTVLSEELPEKSIQLVENYGRDKTKITSYSIVVLKPDYPKGTNPNGVAKTPIVNIRVSKEKNSPVETLAVTIPDYLIQCIKEKYPDIQLIKKPSEAVTRAYVNVSYELFIDFISLVIRETLSKSFTEGSDSFGCCHLYEQCSDARKCLHSNKLYAKGCLYGKNLAAGRIFYGKNRNV